MSTFDLFASDTDTEESGDVLPSAGYGPLDTGLYKMGITLAYMTESKNGAFGLVLHLKNADGTGPEVRQTLYITSGKAKGQRNSYVDTNGVKHKLPGMEMVDNMHALVTGDMFNKAESEEKTVKLWNPATSKEENTPVTTIKGLMNQAILVGMHKVRDNKMERDGDGNYTRTPKERIFNEINKVFEAETGLTYAEKKAKTSDPVYLATWKETFKSDYVRDKYKAVDAGIEADFAKAQEHTKALFP